MYADRSIANQAYSRTFSGMASEPRRWRRRDKYEAEQALLRFLLDAPWTFKYS
jgi:hypothetical protein